MATRNDGGVGTPKADGACTGDFEQWIQSLSMGWEHRVPQSKRRKVGARTDGRAVDSLSTKLGLRTIGFPSVPHNSATHRSES
jgi:hypothetical protein